MEPCNKTIVREGAERNKKTTDIAQHDYPAMRDITGEYAMREVTLK